MTDNDLLALLRKLRESNETMYRHIVAMVKALTT